MKRFIVSTAIAAIVSMCVYAAVVTSAASAQADSYDLLIRNGRIVDGTGAPWYRADIGIRQGRIAAIGRLRNVQAARTIDASELIVAPGFIDMMGQRARPFLRDHNAAFNLLTQGITTINCGEGGSDAPLDGDEAERAGWRTMREFFARLEAARDADEHGADCRAHATASHRHRS